MDFLDDFLSLDSIPLYCFLVIFIFHSYEYRRKSEVRLLFNIIRESWISENFMKGHQAVDAIREYVRVNSFFGNVALLIACLASCFAGLCYTSCKNSDDGCTSYDIEILTKSGMVASLMLSIFLIFTLSNRYMIQLCFMINTSTADGAPLSHRLLRRIFSHAHSYYGVGLRLCFLSIPILAWMFTKWCLVAVTPPYLVLIQSLESSDFMADELSTMRSFHSRRIPVEEAA